MSTDKADIVFPRVKVTVFVDGCFWHGCPQHAKRQPNTNDWYWPKKIARNIARARDTNQCLTDVGWLAVRVWEHEGTDDAAERIMALCNSWHSAKQSGNSEANSKQQLR